MVTAVTAQLRHAGADVAFSPAVIGGQLLGRSATDESDIDDVLASLSADVPEE